MSDVDAIKAMLKEIQEDAYERGLKEGQKLAQQQYAKGYEDGLAMGRALEAREQVSSARKAFNSGWRAAFEEMQELDPSICTCIAA